MNTITINNRAVGPGHPTYMVAEMSANHNQNFDQAVAIIKAAKEAGADAVKLQTYTPDTLTINCHNEYFRIKGTLWEGRNLYDLYGEAYTPWEWQPKLKDVAGELGIELFSTPFDISAVDFLEEMNVAVHKVASFESVDLPLLRRIGQTGKPVIMSTGMATLAEIDEAVQTLRNAGTKELVLLKCTSAYPSPPDAMNLRTIPHLAAAFDVVAGLSDHTLGITVPVSAVTLGACMIEKHFTVARNLGGPDSKFSLEPAEFKAMVEAVRTVERALGEVHYGLQPDEEVSRVFRRSLFVVQEMQPGDLFSAENVRSIRPGHGLHTRFLDEVIGRRASQKIERGTPLDWKYVA
ncbi:MAG: pseudaminic acid synthase [Caldilineaceae bacterium]